MAVATVCTSTFAYKNPVGNISNIGDPGVLRYNGPTYPKGYYMYPTTGTYNGNGYADVGIRCWFSTDLVNWEPRGWVVLSDLTTWAQGQFWGPEVHFRNGYFYIFYAASQALGAPFRISIARGTSPLGPFTEYKAPFFTSAYSDYDAHVFDDDDGKSYLYWTSAKPSYCSISGVQLSADYSSTVGTTVTDLLGPPFSQWELATGSGFPITEGAFMIKNNGTYFLTYSGNSYDKAEYALGYATSTSPLGPFARYVSNPVLQQTPNSTPAILGPGTASIVPSPDGTELFAVYNPHTDPTGINRSRIICIDRVSITNGVLSISGPTTTEQPKPSGVP